MSKFQEQYEYKLTTSASGSILTEGRWREDIPWQFIISDREPDPALCTATFCVTIYNGELLLVNNKSRGWELPGGHLDEGEQLKDALEREILEESGAVIKDPQLFGYKKISPKNPVRYKSTERFYPYPHSYVPYYFAEASELFDAQPAVDIVEVKKVGLKEAKKLLTPGQSHDRIIEHLVRTKKVTIKE